MAKDVVKKNQASMQVIKTLCVLLDGSCTMSELVEKMNLNEKMPIFNSSVISKYINTCRYCGINIPKINNRYFVASLPFGMNLSNRDLDLFRILQEKANQVFSVKASKMFESTIAKISKYSNKYIVRVEKNSANLVFENFEKAIAEQRKINLMLKTGPDLVCVPLKIVENKGKIYLNILVDNVEKLINVIRVTGLQKLDEKFKLDDSDRTVIYKLTGGLAQRYSLREHETIITNELPDYITISNVGEPRDILISRLMRYDKSCKIISPISYREAMLDTINKTLELYGE